MKKVSRIEVIQALKKRFTSNNPASWSKNSDQELAKWYAEYILNDAYLEIKIEGSFFCFTPKTPDTMNDLKTNATSVEVNQKALEERMIEDIKEMDMDTLKTVFEFMYPVKVEDVEGMEGEEVRVTSNDGTTLDQIF